MYVCVCVCVCSVWCVVCGVWCVVCGVWCVVCARVKKPSIASSELTVSNALEQYLYHQRKQTMQAVICCLVLLPSSFRSLKLDFNNSFTFLILIFYLSTPSLDCISMINEEHFVSGADDG